MRNQIAKVKNISSLWQAGQALRSRSVGVPGIGLVWGATGYGKTTAAAWFANEVNAVYVRAFATWTPTAMLGAICRELSAQPMARCSTMIDFIVEQLTTRGRPLFVDEADYLVGNKKLLETLRDLHDMATTPLILIGMADFRRKVVHREQLAGRIAQWVNFRPADIADARTLTEAVCEVDVADDLLEELHCASRGSMRDMIVGLDRVERWAKRQGKAKVASKDWNHQPFTLATAEG
jgi:DNA transposition AAA+ family ATPase